MKEEITELAVKIHVHFMEEGEEECPDFWLIFNKTKEYYDIESPKDLHFVAFAIEQLMQCFDVLTAEWLIESKDHKSRQRDEDLLRGEI